MTQADRVYKWPYPVMSITQDDIACAVADENWQSFRMSLKGLPTDVKLAKLLSRYETASRIANMEPTTLHLEAWKRTRIQVWNYLNALRRGGQLDGTYTVRR